MAPSLADEIAVQEVGVDQYVSQALPKATGNGQPIAYGGYTISICVHAACKTTDSRLNVYSVLGTFLGPARTDRKIHCRVSRVRSTKTFASRHVVAYQLQDDGSERSCIQCLVDFHVKEPAMLSYNAPPPAALGNDPLDLSRSLPWTTVLQRAVDKGLITERHEKAYLKLFGLMVTYFDTHACTESVNAQNALGMAKNQPTSQDRFPVHEKLAAEWTRLKHPLETELENMVALTFCMDAGLSFLPLHLNFMDFGDASVCSSLDFALRIMQPTVDLHKWHARERKTHNAAGGRTYSESRLWGEDGQMVAVMTQTCILRGQKQDSASPSARL